MTSETDAAIVFSIIALGVSLIGALLGMVLQLRMRRDFMNFKKVIL